MNQISDNILQTASDLTDQARSTAMSYFRQTLEVEMKEDESPVTAADKHIEREVRETLEKRFPDHSILGEEYGAGDLNNNHVWVIDPIDGTRSFMTGHPLFGFLLAYLNKGIVEHSIVSMPALNERYVGTRIHGATLNGQRIRCSKTLELEQALIYINEGDKLFESVPYVHSNLLSVGHTRRFSYDCYPHALLAAGHVDVVVDYDLKPFDYLPLAGVIEAAGGIISDWQGNALDYDSDGCVVSAATPQLHRQILSVLTPGIA